MRTTTKTNSTPTTSTYALNLLQTLRPFYRQGLGPCLTIHLYEADPCTDGLRKEARRNHQEAPQEVAPTPVRHIQVCAFSMEKAKGYR